MRASLDSRRQKINGMGLARWGGALLHKEAGASSFLLLLLLVVLIVLHLSDGEKNPQASLASFRPRLKRRRGHVEASGIENL